MRIVNVRQNFDKKKYFFLSSVWGRVHMYIHEFSQMGMCACAHVRTFVLTWGSYWEPSSNAFHLVTLKQADSVEPRARPLGSLASQLALGDLLHLPLGH